MIDVLKRLAELDAVNPNRPEYKAEKVQSISTALSESAVEECGEMPGMVGGMSRPSTPASVNMTAASGEELGDLIRAIATLAGTASQAPAEPLSAPPAMATTSPDGMDMRAMIDKLNPMDDEEGEEDDEETDEAYDNTPADPTDTNEFDAEEFAHHENPPGADRKGNAMNPRAYDTNESVSERLMAEYQKFISEN